MITQAGMSGPDNKMPTETTQKCTRKDQFVASSRSYQELKLVGIVSQGTQRKVLLTDGLRVTSSSRVTASAKRRRS